MPAQPAMIRQRRAQQSEEAYLELLSNVGEQHCLQTLLQQML